MKGEKKSIKRSILIMLLSLPLFLTNCDKDSTGPIELSENAAARKEVEVITEFAAVKQSVTYDILKIFSLINLVLRLMGSLNMSTVV